MLLNSIPVTLIATLFQILVQYEAVKEVRTVRQQFYPLMYHLTRIDIGNIAKSISSMKPVLEQIKAK